MPEQWRPIPRYAGRYEASDLGRVRSLWFINGKVCRPREHPLVLKASPTSGPIGYLAVSLADGHGHWRTESIHVLVLEAFVGRRPTSGHEGAHGDGNPRNNRLTNLSWKTAKENEADKLIHGTHVRGERNGFSRLTTADVLAIRRRHASGEKGRALATQYGVTATQISRIVLRQVWQHVPPEADVVPRQKHSKPVGYRNDWRKRRTA